MNFHDTNWLMDTALQEAITAYNKDEVPVGAVVTDVAGKILAKAHNLKEKNKDASAHAEILALREAASRFGDWRLVDCNIYVTLEPCLMCMNAISHFRIKNLFFGAYDKKGGALSLGHQFHNDQRLNHRFNVMGGIMHYECSKLISDFFKQKRENYNQSN